MEILWTHNSPRSCVAPYQCLVHIADCRTGAAELVMKKKSRCDTGRGHLEASPAGVKDKQTEHNFSVDPEVYFFWLSLIWSCCLFPAFLSLYLLSCWCRTWIGGTSFYPLWRTYHQVIFPDYIKPLKIVFIPWRKAFSSSLNMVLWGKGLPVYICR